MCWNWFDEAHHHRGRGEPAMIVAVVRRIASEFAVDPTRVYSAGLSAGGAMAVILGRTYPELFAAIGCHSGLAHESATDYASALRVMKEGVDAHALPPRQLACSVPIIVFHGDADLTVHPKNGASIVQQFVDSYAAQPWAEPVDISVAIQSGRAGGRRFTRQVHQGKGAQVVAEHWTINGGGHAWSGGVRAGSYTDVAGPNVSSEMLQFFLRHRLPRAASLVGATTDIPSHQDARS
jgi:poly(3-hydroxybutyrate) depolymerase